ANPILLELPFALAEGSVVELTFSRAGASLGAERLVLASLSEGIEVPADARALPGGPDSGVTVIEILATSPAERERLQSLDLQADGKVSVEIRANGLVIDTLPWTELAQRSEALLEAAALPAAIEPRYLPAASPGLHNVSAHLTACEENCWIDYDLCYDGCVWVPNSGPCFDSCNANLNACLAACSTSCTPSTTTTTTITILGYVQTNIVKCAWDSSLGSADYYRRYLRKRKKTVTTTTTNADCSQTVTTTVTYPNNYCWGFAGPGPCTPTEYDLNQCTF
ncbi:MAG: hypothetical protein KDD47_02985, partial [Acidobacteria bacterium]|nr:hypothetical protein [Acidobacteriota bacterium]